MRIITVILDIILIALCSVFKISYYISDSKVSTSGSFFDILWYLWIPISMLITLSPMLIQLALLIFMKSKQQLFAFLLPMFLWFGDMAFEVISMIGGSMSLDDDWIGISVTMLKCGALFIIPLVFSLISFIISLKKKPVRL